MGFGEVFHECLQGHEGQSRTRSKSVSVFVLPLLVCSAMNRGNLCQTTAEAGSSQIETAAAGWASQTINCSQYSQMQSLTCFVSFKTHFRLFRWFRPVSGWFLMQLFDWFSLITLYVWCVFTFRSCPCLFPALMMSLCTSPASHHLTGHPALCLTKAAFYNFRHLVFFSWWAEFRHFFDFSLESQLSDLSMESSGSSL